MNPEPLIPHKHDPIYVSRRRSGHGSLVLRIGGYRQGEGRYAFVTPHNAKILAYALLRLAEGPPESN
jgi:hypothetical protein